jgi:hypothetical protein
VKVKVISASVDFEGVQKLEKALNGFLVEAGQPVVEHITHYIHENRHWITIWYLNVSLEKKG